MKPFASRSGLPNDPAFHPREATPSVGRKRELCSNSFSLDRDSSALDSASPYMEIAMHRPPASAA